MTLSELASNRHEPWAGAALDPAPPLPRIIPCLLLEDRRLVKTVRFKDPKYIGDPFNAVRILNEKEVDELVFLDIASRRTGRPPDIDLVRRIASECFMPLAYGGGVCTLDQVRAILGCGAEKVVINTAALETPALIEQAAGEFGSQSVVISIEVKRTLFGVPRVTNGRLHKMLSLDPAGHAKAMVLRGAGEIFLNDVDRDGMRGGYDLNLIRSVSAAIDVPTVACGGAGSIADLAAAIAAGASAAAAGSLFTLYGKHRAVLITYPEQADLRRALALRGTARA
jgi:imidazole glycerol-phosphate synthase subunit HisF